MYDATYGMYLYPVPVPFENVQTPDVQYRYLLSYIVQCLRDHAETIPDLPDVEQCTTYSSAKRKTQNWRPEIVSRLIGAVTTGKK